MSAATEWNESTRLVERLLEEEQRLTAVDEFSTHHAALEHDASLYEALLPTSLPAEGEQYAFRVDLDACTGCKACVTACHSLNGLDEDEQWRRVGLLESTAPPVEAPRPQTVTSACHHCEDPGCLAGCPVRAYEKDETTGIVHHLDYYDLRELSSIVTRSAEILGIPIDPTGAEELARRSRGTPRVANRLLRRVRDFVQVDGGDRIDADSARGALERLDVDRFGLDQIDRRLLLTILDKFDGGPVGLSSLAAAIGEDQGTLEEIYEPYLLQIGFLDRTPRGRRATRRAAEHLGHVRPQDGHLF